MRRFLVVLAVLASAFASLASVSTASAAVTFEKQAPDHVLYGTEADVTLHAANSGAYVYNLTLRDVLPAGVSYVPGSAAVEPRVIQDAPATGQTTLIFDNVSDLSGGSSYDLTYRTRHDTTKLGIGDAVSLVDAVPDDRAGAYANSDVRTVPKFDARGLPAGGYTASATGQADTRISAVEIRKSEPSPEHELLRGVHDHPTVYTLKVTNNQVRPTSSIRVEDYLPAGLEFLGCGTDDHTGTTQTNPGSPREYPGAPALNAGTPPAMSDCLTPALVETVRTDPDGAGPLPTAVYTHVVWTSVGTLAAGQSREIQYVAAVPLLENTLTWGAGVDSPASLRQGSNLSNNRGAETRDEQALTNYATAAGDYDGTLPVTDADYLTVTAEDLAIQKSASSRALEPGAITTWTLNVQTSEYRRTEDLRITDELPNGLCPLGPQNYESTSGGGQSPECAPDGAAGNPTAPYTTVEEQADGTFDIAWDKTTYPALARVAPSSRLTLEFPTRSRSHYQQDYADAAPVLTGDSWTNRVDISGTGFRICAPSDPLCTTGGTPIAGSFVDGTTIEDTSSAGQTAGGISIDKTVLDAPTNARPVDCTTGTYVGVGSTAYAPPRYAPGDRVCWQLRVDFSAKLFTGKPTLRDFLPPGVVYDSVQPAGAGKTANNTVDATMKTPAANDTVLEWELGDGSTVSDQNLVFEWRIATRYVGGTSTVPTADVPGNLMKLSYANTAGQTFPLRDRVEIEPIAAQLGLVKGVQQINAGTVNGFGSNVDNQSVEANDAVTYRVDLSNAGLIDAKKAEVWDDLPAGISCTDLVAASISDGGTCAAVPGVTGRSRITWTGIEVAAATSPSGTVVPGRKTLTYTVTVPDGVGPDRDFQNTAGVVRYVSETNTGGEFTYVPTSNIDPSAPTGNAAPAKDTSMVSTRKVVVAKSRTTAITESGNGTGDATIGERIDYTVDLTIPHGTTVYSAPVLVDALGARQQLVTTAGAQAPTATLDGGALPADVSLDLSVPNTVRLVLPATYRNDPGTNDDVFRVRFSAIVVDASTNQRTGAAANWTLPNQASFKWRSVPDETDRNRNSNTVNTTIVEPNLAIAKTHAGSSVVAPGDRVTYTVTATNTAGTRVAPAHDVKLVDTLPAGVTPDLATITNGGVWDGTARTITWSPASTEPGGLAPGANVARSYAVTIDDPATAASKFVNTAVATGDTLTGAATGQRDSTTAGSIPGYRAQKQDTVTLGGATVTKKVATPGGTPADAVSATIGDDVEYTVDLRLPAGVRFYDTTVVDVLPDGVRFDAADPATCVSGCATADEVPATLLPRSTAADGRTTVGWYVGDLASAPADRVVRFVYRGHVARTFTPGAPPAQVVDGGTVTNVVRAYYNGSDKLTTDPTTTPAPGTFDETTAPADADVNVIEPKIAIDKNVSGDTDGDDARTTQPGDAYTYELLVKNTGTAPAYDVDVTDDLDQDRLKDVVLTDGAARATDADATDGSLRWTIPGPIAPGATVTLRYTAKLAPSAALTDGDTVVNVADVARFWGVPKAEREANGFDYREYTDVSSDTVTLTVALPTLQVQKTTGGAGFPDQADAQVGEALPWRIVVRNTSTVAVAKDVALRDVLPANWEYVAGSASFAPAVPAGNPTEPGGTTTGGVRTMTWADIGDLGPGGSRTLTLLARPTAAALATPGSGATHLNVNAADATAKDASGATASKTGPYADDDDARALLRTPKLEVEKTPDAGSVLAGNDATYSVVVKNTGDAPAREVVVRDVLGAGQRYAAGQATAVPATGFAETAPVVDPDAKTTTTVWRIAEIPAGESVTIKVPVGTAPSLAKGTTLQNDAAATSREITTPVEDDGSLLVDTSADVRLKKTFANNGVAGVPGKTVDFDLVVTNDGPSDALAVKVQDTLPDGLTFDAFVTGGTDCTTATAAGKETITCVAGTLAPDATRTYTVRAKVDSGWTTPIKNVATSTTDTSDPDPDNNTGEDTTSMGVESNLVVKKTAPALPIPQGVEFDYVVTVENQGSSDAVDVQLHDDMPDEIALVRATTDRGTCAPSTGPDEDDVDCALGTLKPGQVATITIRAKGLKPGVDIENVAKATTTSAQTSTDDDEATAKVTVPPVADLQVVKTAPATVAAGGTIRYALEVKNNGPSDATGVRVTDPLPAGTTFASADPGCALAGTTVTCAVGDLAVGASRTLHLEVRAPLATAGRKLTNVATVAGDQLDLVQPNDSSQATTVVGPAADLSIQKAAGGAVAGGTATWTIVVRNDGPTAAENVHVKDPLPAGTTFASATGSQGTCAASGADVDCDLGTIPSGGSAQIAVTARVDAGLTGQTLRNVATVVSDTPDPEHGNDTSSADVVVTPAPPTDPDLRVTKVASTAKPKLGQTVTYRIAVTNHGETTARDVRLVDTMSGPARVDRVRVSQGRCTTAKSGPTCALGALAPGATATVVVDVTPTRSGALRNAVSVLSAGQTEPSMADNSAVAGVSVARERATATLTKRASKRTVRGGGAVTFTLKATMGRGAAGENVRVCDRLPAGLVFVRAKGATIRGTRACWTVPFMAAGSSRTFRVVARAERSGEARTIRNVATLTGTNVRKRSAAATVRVPAAVATKSGGVTG